MTRHGLSALLDACQQLKEKRSAVLATVIDTEGSSYRKAGARMLINLADQAVTGIVGGGCFDDDLIEHARAVAETQQCQVAYYDMRADDDVLWGLGMGCNGAVRVLLQPLVTAGELLELLAAAHGQGGRINTDLVSGKSWQASADAEPGLTTHGGSQVFTDVILPQFRLGIFGGGSDVLPVIDLADQLDWHIALWDHRPGRARADRFPKAAMVHPFVNQAPAGAERCGALLVMSHNFDADLRFLNAVAALEVPFVGTLGPISRRLRLLEQMDQVPAEFPATLFGPVGLALGGELPEEIALSVVSQIQAFKNRRCSQVLPQTTDQASDQASDLASDLAVDLAVDLAPPKSHKQ